MADEDEEEEEEEEVVENDRHGRSGGYAQVHRPAHPQAYGHAQQQGYGQVHQQAYGQAYQQAYRQPNPYQEQDYEMAQRAALGLRVRPAQVWAHSFPYRHLCWVSVREISGATLR